MDDNNYDDEHVDDSSDENDEEPVRVTVDNDDSTDTDDSAFDDEGESDDTTETPDPRQWKDLTLAETGQILRDNVRDVLRFLGLAVYYLAKGTWFVAKTAAKILWRLTTAMNNVASLILLALAGVAVASFIKSFDLRIDTDLADRDVTFSLGGDDAGANEEMFDYDSVEFDFAVPRDAEGQEVEIEN